MKKLVLAFGLFVGVLSFAQIKPQFGVKAGMNVSNLSNIDESNAKVGFVGGVFMNAPIAEQFSIQPEVLYNQLGAKASYYDSGIHFKETLKLDYISVPVMVQYKATPKFYVEAGPEFGFLVSSKAKVSGDGESYTGNIDSSNFHTFNLGIGLGVGYDIISNIGINARYVAGLTNVTKPDFSDYKSKNNTFQVGLYYKFK